MTPEQHLELAHQALQELQAVPEVASNPDEFVDLGPRVVDVMVQASRLSHEATLLDDQLPRAVFVGGWAYDLWEISEQRVRGIRHLAEHAGEALLNRDLRVPMGSEGRLASGPVPSKLGEQVMTPGTQESVLRDVFVMGGGRGKYTYTFVPRPGSAYEALLSDTADFHGHLQLATSALLQARASVARYPDAMSANELQTAAIEMLKQANQTYRRLGATAHRGEVVVVLVEDQPYDLTGSRKKNLGVLWLMADNPWKLFPGPALREAFDSDDPFALRALLADLRDPKRPEHVLYDRLLRGGTYHEPAFGLRGRADPPKGLHAVADSEAFQQTKTLRAHPKPKPSPSPKAKRYLARKLPVIELQADTQPEITEPDPAALERNVTKLMFEGHTLPIEHLSIPERRIAAHLITNAGRWFSDDEATVFFTDRVSASSRRQYLNRFRLSVSKWQANNKQHRSELEALERYVELAKDQSGVHLMRFVPPAPIIEIPPPPTMGEYDPSSGLYEAETYLRQLILDSSRALFLPTILNEHHIRRVLRSLAGEPELERRKVKERFQTINSLLHTPKGLGETREVFIKRLLNENFSAQGPSVLQVEGFYDPAGACFGLDNRDELFYPDRGESTLPAKEICLGCSALESCAIYALDSGEDYGVWGALSGRQRTELRGMPERRTHIDTVIETLEGMWAKDRQKIARRHRRT